MKRTSSGDNAEPRIMGGIKQYNNMPMLNEFAPKHSNMLNLVMTASEQPTEILI